MFKRVEKRKRRKEVEEELGIDEDMKEVLGMHDTDSDESDSDSDERSVSSVDEINEMSDKDDDGSELGVEEGEGEEGEDPSITVGEALRDPIYLVSLEPETRACIICPGKLLKSIKMVALHRDSNACTLSFREAHKRRFSSFAKLAKDEDYSSSAFQILKEVAEDRPDPSSALDKTSNRAEKRKKNQTIQKARREKAKTIKAAKKNAAAITSATNSPEAAQKLAIKQVKTSPNSPKKRQKSMPSALKTIVTQEEKASSDGPRKEEPSTTASTVNLIAKSASDRAKKARSRSSIMRKSSSTKA